MDKGLELTKLSEVVKALEDGHKLQSFRVHVSRWVDIVTNDVPEENDLHEIAKDLKNGDKYRIKPEPETVSFYANWFEDDKAFGSLTRGQHKQDGHKITLKVDPNTGKPICNTITMEEIK